MKLDHEPLRKFPHNFRWFVLSWSGSEGGGEFACEDGEVGPITRDRECDFAATGKRYRLATKKHKKLQKISRTYLSCFVLFCGTKDFWSKARQLLIRLFPNLRHNSRGSRIPQPVSINYLLIIYENTELAEPAGNGLDLKSSAFFNCLATRAAIAFLMGHTGQ
jgi:hypothetical protein